MRINNPFLRKLFPIGSSIIMCFIFLLIHNMNGAKDIGLYDESFYLNEGINFSFEFKDGLFYFLYI